MARASHPSVGDIASQRVASMVRTHVVLLGLTAGTLALLVVAGSLSTETIGLATSMVAVSAMFAGGAWLALRSGLSRHAIVVGLLVVDSILMLLLFYRAGEFETPALGLLALPVAMGPIYTRRSSAWVVALIQIAGYAALLGLRFGGGVPGLPYGYRLPADALRDPELLFLSLGAFATFTLGVAFLAGAASMDLIKSRAQLEAAVEQRTRELEAARASLELRNEQLAATNQALELFSVAVGHDLRSPLQVIRIDAETLADGDGDARRLGRHIDDYVTRIDDMLQGLLRLARVRSETTKLAAIDSRRMCETAWTNLGADPAELQLAGADTALVGDEAQLTRALQNLFQNARRHGDQPRVRVDLGEETGGWVLIGVEDDGHGVHEDDRRSIFEPFHSVPGRPQGATGTGLAIVSQIVSAHGGDVYVESGKVLPGARFVIRLPQAGPAAGEKETDTEDIAAR